MTPKELVGSWRILAKEIHNNPDDYSIGVRGAVLACADGLELEIERSNFVSGKEITESELENEIWANHFKMEGGQKERNARNIAKILLSKYHIIAK